MLTPPSLSFPPLPSPSLSFRPPPPPVLLCGQAVFDGNVNELVRNVTPLLKPHLTERPDKRTGLTFSVEFKKRYGAGGGRGCVHSEMVLRGH